MVNSPHFHFRGFDPWSGCGTKIPHAKCVLIKRVKKKERKKKKIGVLEGMYNNMFTLSCSSLTSQDTF